MRQEIPLCPETIMHLAQTTEMSYVELEVMHTNARMNNETVVFIIDIKFEKRAT